MSPALLMGSDLANGGPSWSCLELALTWGQALVSPHRKHPCNFLSTPITKTWMCKPNAPCYRPNIILKEGSAHEEN